MQQETLFKPADLYFIKASATANTREEGDFPLFLVAIMRAGSICGLDNVIPAWRGSGSGELFEEQLCSCSRRLGILASD